MQGRRIYPDQDGYIPDLKQPGDYGCPTAENIKKWWHIITPNGHHGSLNPEVHKVTEHEDGTITVSPSIIVRIRKFGEKEFTEVWHGFLEKGSWREA